MTMYRHYQMLYVMLAATILVGIAAPSQAKMAQGAYPLGVLGGSVSLNRDGAYLEVKTLDQKAAGYKGGLRVGDRIIGAGDKKFPKGSGALYAFGNTLDRALESGYFQLLVVRSGVEMKLKMGVPIWGRLGDEWPFEDTERVQAFRAGVCAYLNDLLLGKKGRITAYNGGAIDVTRCMAALALLASAEPEYLETAGKVAKSYARNPTPDWGSNWKTFFVGVFMTEYYLSTRDEDVLKWIEGGVALAESHMNEFGRLGHGGAFPGGTYGRDCGFNAPMAGTLWFLALAEKCGVEIDLKKWNGMADTLEGSMARNGAVGYCMYIKGGGDAHARTANTMLGLLVKQKRKRTRQRLGDWLIGNVGSIRVSHAYSVPGVFATFLALYMHDPDECTKHFQAMRWYFTMSEQPDHTAAYIGGDGNNGGDFYLTMPHIMAANIGIILSAPKQHLFMYGGLPIIPGISPGALSPRMLDILKTLSRTPPIQTLRTLRSIIEFGPTSEDAEPAIIMGRYIYEEEVKPFWKDVVDVMATGDLYKAQEIFESFLKVCGRPPPLKDEIKLLEATLDSPRGREILKRGAYYYDLLDRWTTFPENKPRYRKEIELIAKDVSDIYGRKSRGAVKALAKSDAQREAFESMPESEIEAQRSLGL